MEHVVYILYSPGSKRNYTGSTSHLIKRFPSHNIFGKDSTAKYRPWIVAHIEFFDSKQEALKKETYYKSGRGSIKKREIIIDFLARWAHTLP
jgi:putative endonuclease